MISKDREKAFLDALKQSGATFGIGDDGVDIGYIVANDAFFEDVHFKLVWGDLQQIVEKCFLVNLSDIYAMNAIPHFAILTLCLPKNFKQTKDLAVSLANCSKKYQIKIIGGDTLVGDKLHFSLTLLGQKRKKTLKRSRIQKGDILGYITPKSVLNFTKQQSFGSNLKHLQFALRFCKKTKIPKNTRFAKPLLYPKMLFALNDIAKAGMDISDGIFMELSRLSTINKLGFNIFKKGSAWLYSPEEYQMLYAVSKKNLKKMQNKALQHRHAFVPFALATRGKYHSNKQNWHS